MPLSPAVPPINPMQLFLTGLNSKKTVESTKNLNESVKGINKAQENGALTDLKSSLDMLKGAISGPMMEGIKFIVTKFQALSAGTTAEAMVTWIEAADSQTVLQVLQALAAVFEFLGGGSLSENAQSIIKLLDAMGGIGGFIDYNIQAVKDWGKNIIEAFLEGIAKFVGDFSWSDWIARLFEKAFSNENTAAMILSLKSTMRDLIVDFVTGGIGDIVLADLSNPVRDKITSAFTSGLEDVNLSNIVSTIVINKLGGNTT